MKNRQFLFLFFMLCAIFKGNAQDYPFGEATIKLKSGDSVKCYVELASTYFNKVYYRNQLKGEDLEFKSKQIKSIRTQYSFWENITYGKKENLMSLIVDGKAKLYAYIIENEGSKGNLGAVSYSFSTPKITYVIMHGSQFTELRKKNFIEVLEKILSECDPVVIDLKNKVYKYEEINKAIEKYNRYK